MYTGALYFYIRSIPFLLGACWLITVVCRLNPDRVSVRVNTQDSCPLIYGDHGLYVVAM